MALLEPDRQRPGERPGREPEKGPPGCVEEVEATLAPRRGRRLLDEVDHEEENVPLAEILCRPRLGRVLEVTRVVEGEPLVLGHPTGVGLERGGGVAPPRCEVRAITGSRGGSGPGSGGARCRTRRSSASSKPSAATSSWGWTVRRINSMHFSRNRSSAVSSHASSSTLTELPAPRPGPWNVGCRVADAWPVGATSTRPRTCRSPSSALMSHSARDRTASAASSQPVK